MSLKNILSRFGELLMGLAILGGSIYIYFYISGDSAGMTSQRQPMVPTVMLATLAQETLITEVEALGTGLAKESVDLTAKAQEKVIKINFDDGMYVEKGQLLLELENETELAELNQAQINLEEQERELARIEPLYQARVSSQKDYDERKTAYERNKALLSIVKVRLNDRLITAPFSGQLGKRMVALGNLVSPGTLITTLDDISEIKVDFNVPEKYFSLLKEDQEFTVQNVAYPDRKFKGKISMVSVRLNNITKSVDVRGIIPNVADENGKLMLRPGMLFVVSLVLGTHEAVVIPEKAIMSLGEMQFIFVYNKDGSTVERREITLGQRSGGNVEITSGAKAGETYVIEGVSKLTDNMKVIVSTDEKYLKRTPSPLAKNSIKNETEPETGVGAQ